MNMKMAKPRSILIIQPNSTKAMTKALVPLVDALGFHDTSIEYFTAPSGPSSINNEDDAVESVKHVLPALKESNALEKHDAFLVACYSKHPLVHLLKEEGVVKEKRKPVTGIFEASVTTSLQLMHPRETFGIVSTGKVWEDILTEAVHDFLGAGNVKRFAGVHTTGLNATELHDAPQDLVEKKVTEAVKRLLKDGEVGAICLGCAGMSGMDEWVKDACVDQLGEERGKRVRVVDGVTAGVAWLEGVLRL